MKGSKRPILLKKSIKVSTAEKYASEIEIFTFGRGFQMQRLPFLIGFVVSRYLNCSLSLLLTTSVGTLDGGQCQNVSHPEPAKVLVKKREYSPPAKIRD
jgi:hypothetical protein